MRVAHGLRRAGDARRHAVARQQRHASSGMHIRRSSDGYLHKILNARVYDVCEETPLQEAPVLSAKYRNQVFFKREDLQPVFSFKIRGAYNKIASLTAEQLADGIVACSAGNHAQGVAYSVAKIGCDNIIVMPTGTPAIKVDAVRKWGGNVLLHGTQRRPMFILEKSHPFSAEIHHYFNGKHHFSDEPMPGSSGAARCRRCLVCSHRRELRRGAGGGAAAGAIFSLFFFNFFLISP